MRGISGLFRRSPFGPLTELMEKVRECVLLIQPIFDELKAGDQVRVKEIAKELMAKEHEADKVKAEVRDHLPRSLMMPVDRRDVLHLVESVDEIADYAEDIGVLLTMREMTFPTQLEDRFNEFLAAVLATFDKSEEIIGRLDTLAQTAFGGPEAEEVFHLINEIGQLEWEADKRQYKLGQELYRLEDVESPVAIILWSRIFQCLGNLANASEKLGKMLRLILTK